MALSGPTLSLASIPGVSSLLSRLDSVKAQFLAVPAQANAALDKLALVRTAMARNNAPPSAQSDALKVEQHIRQVQSEWNVAAASFQHVDMARQTGAGLSLDTITAAGLLVASVSYVLGNMKTLTSSVDTLAAKYLTAQQRAQLSAGAVGGVSLGVLLAGGAALYFLSRRRG